MIPLAYMDPGSGGSIFAVVMVIAVVCVCLALLFALVKFIKWAWGAGDRDHQ